MPRVCATLADMSWPGHFERRSHPLAWLLWPVSCVYASLVWLRGVAFRRGWFGAGAAAQPNPVPVVVVGNITVGGSGKTPLVQAVVAELQALGWHPGIVSRGYGGMRQLQPVLVTPRSDPLECGDEPVLHALCTGVPVCVCVRRPAAVSHLVEQTAVDIVVSDDGLQHLALARDLEIAVFDAQAGFGNGWMLPAGPLREPVVRLQRVDLMALQQDADETALPAELALPRHVPHGSFHLQPQALRDLGSGEVRPLSWLQGRAVHAVAALGNPQRFFASLSRLGAEVTAHALGDHDAYAQGLPSNLDDRPVVVTSKDAVKLMRRCHPSRLAHVHELQVRVDLGASLRTALLDLLRRLGPASDVATTAAASGLARAPYSR